MFRPVMFAIAALVGATLACAPSSRAERPAPVDPLEQLGLKLAEKLGAERTPNGDGSFVMRVPSRGAAAGKAARGATGAASAPVPTKAWSYAGAAGPDAWGRLHPDFSTCTTGQRQSPIDLTDGIRVDLEPVRFDYHPSTFSVLDTGRTVQVNLQRGNTIEVMGRRYALEQFHFHRPAEQRIDGRQFEMDAQLVHRADDGRIAVVALQLEKGDAQPWLQAVWNNLPLEKGDELAAAAALDLNQLLPADRRYFVFMGSQTTPPCREGVLWIVLKQPVSISQAQLEIFARLYPMNARPLQPLAGRLVKESN